MVGTLQRVLRVDCPGSVANNMSSVERVTKIRNNGARAKMVFIKNYLFNLCPENDIFSGYVTEKLMQSCVAGCIPIYWGTTELEPGIINPKRVIMCSSRTDIGPTARAKILKLMTDETALEQFFDQPVFLPTARARILEIRSRFNGMMKRIATKNH